MDVDVVGEVLIVVDGRQGVVGDVVEVDEVALRVVLNSIVKLQEVFTSFTQGHIKPGAIFDGHLCHPCSSSGRSTPVR